MRYKITALFFLFIVFFSFKSFAQTTPSSDHPLLDKYYPRPEKTDTAKTIVHTPPTAPVKAPLVSTTIAPPTPPPPPPKPVDTVDKSVPQTTTVSQIQTTSAVKDTFNTAKPITAIVQLPAPKKISSPAANPPPAIDTRLGSSTPQYDTWKKNNDGAGSVTTSPK